MAKGSRGRQRLSSRQVRSSPYSLASCDSGISGDMYLKRCSIGLDKKEWDDITCSVCMECPHNAVLLLCSSHDKGCRPYMCGTSFRYSNCLDQYKNAYTKVISSNQGQHLPSSVEGLVATSDTMWPVEKCEVTELACPLCRGQVKGWTVVEPLREYFNSKTRNCMQDGCSFQGTFKELRKHMKAEHPSAQPREVDPDVERKWRRLERERERNDVMSTIRSTMPGAMVLGDYVIEGNRYHSDSDEYEQGGDDDDDVVAAGNGEFDVGFQNNLINVFLLLHAFGPVGNDLGRRLRQQQRDELALAVDVQRPNPLTESSDQENDSDSNYGNGGHGPTGMSLVNRLRRHGRELLGRSARRRRRREAGGS